MGYTIYSVEDDKDISKIINKTLSKQGYNVSSFYDASSFLDAFNTTKPDMVLLDMMLPDLSGGEILKVIRKNPANDDISVIIISANDLVTDKIEGLDMGADDYISKPFDLLELISRVNARFRKYKKTTKFQYEGLILDTETHEVYYNDMLVDLTVKEFSVLELLLKNLGKVVTRDDILNEIWGSESLETRVIDMHIKAIRKKLGNEEIIKTVYGLGYKI